MLPIQNELIGIQSERLLNYWQLFFFNRYLYSFFNSFCKKGKKDLALKLVYLLLTNLKKKTYIPPVLLLKSILLNFKQFFKINVIKFRRKKHYTISQLSHGNQIKHSIRSLMVYFNDISDNDKAKSLISRLTSFFLSLFFKDDQFYGEYLVTLVTGQNKIKNLIDDAGEFTDKINKKKKKKKIRNRYLSKLLKIRKKKKKPRRINLTLLSKGRTKVSIRVNRFTPMKKQVVTKRSYKPVRIKGKKKDKGKDDTYEEIDGLGGISLRSILFNPFINANNSIKKQIIMYFFRSKYRKLYYLSESIYYSIFQSTIYSFYSLYKKAYTTDKFIINQLEGNTLREINKGEIEAKNILPKIKYFVLWLLHVTLGINLNNSMVNNPLIYKLILLDKSFIKFFTEHYRYFFSVEHSENSFGIPNVKISDTAQVLNSTIHDDLSNVYLNDNSVIYNISNVGVGNGELSIKKRLFNYLSKIIAKHKRRLKRVEMKKKLKEIIQNKRKHKSLFNSIKFMLRKNIFSNISRSIYSLTLKLFRRLIYMTKTINTKRKRKHISYHFKRKIVMNYF